jgi:YVTN family beta-propeller protein
LLVYVTNSAAGTVSVVDAALRMGVAVIEVGTTPMGVAVGVLPPEPPTPTATATPAPCAGDCRGDGSVDVGDLVLAVRIALGQDALAACSRADANGDGVLTVDELVVAASNALGACVP